MADLGSVLKNGERMNGDDRITSPNGKYFLTIQKDDSNLVAYYTEGGKTRSVWSADCSSGPGGYAIMQSDGNFVVYDSKGNARWSSGTALPSGQDASGYAVIIANTSTNSDYGAFYVGKRFYFNF